MNNDNFRRNVRKAVYAYKELLDTHCTNGDPIHEITTQYGVSRNVLQQVFKECCGAGIRQYKLKLRMERSRELLEAGKDIKEVAIILRYSKSRAFSTAFKNYYGMTPSDFASSVSA